jgi:2-oxo-4-hydroxy-4-carboxy-5-ureidoimidazoline decarboxylase
MLSDSQLLKICSSSAWIGLMRESMPLHDRSHAERCVQHAFSMLAESDWLDAFAGHPMIGNISTLRTKYQASKELSANEQGLVRLADESTLEQLVELNQAYLDKFGFIFIVCASGKSADEMLTMLKVRIQRSKTEELAQAALEQQKISAIRMEAYL